MLRHGGIICGIALSLCLAAPCVARAQEQGPPPPDGMGPPPGGDMVPRLNVDREVDRLTKRYNLSDDQKAQVRTILTDEKQKLDALAKDSSLAPEDLFAKMKAIHEDETARISAVMTADQRAKYESDQKKRQHREGEEGPDGAPPPPPDDGGGGPPPM